MKLRNCQTGEIREGTFEELSNLDNRVWHHHLEVNDDGYITVEGKFGSYQVKTA